MTNVNLRELLKEDFGLDFPITGGLGNSIDNPIVIERQNPNDYTGTEYGVLRCIGSGRGVEWKLLQQQVLKHNGRTIDQLKIQTIKVTDDEEITQRENWYFDITDCVDF